MIDRRGPELDAFEERLLSELMGVVEAQAAAAGPEHGLTAAGQRRRWYLPTAGAAAAAVAVVIALVVTSRPEPAFAVTGRNGEEVTVQVTRLEGAEALERALGERGIAADITYLPTGKVCRPGRYAEVSTRGLALGVAADSFTVTIPPDAVGPDNTFVLSAAVTPLEDGVQATVDFDIAQGPVAPCTVADER